MLVRGLGPVVKGGADVVRDREWDGTDDADGAEGTKDTALDT